MSRDNPARPLAQALAAPCRFVDAGLGGCVPCTILPSIVRHQELIRVVGLRVSIHCGRGAWFFHRRLHGVREPGDATDYGNCGQGGCDPRGGAIRIAERTSRSSRPLCGASRRHCGRGGHVLMPARARACDCRVFAERACKDFRITTEPGAGTSFEFARRCDRS